MGKFLLIFLFLVLGSNGLYLDQGSSLRMWQNREVGIEDITEEIKIETPIMDDGKVEEDLITGGLPGQPPYPQFNQYSGFVSVGKGRYLFYYFVESLGSDPTSNPLVLWLNGGPGCSSVGLGAFTENGPFGVKQDGKTLYFRDRSWNRVANMLYLESPIGVGFSYSDASDESVGDSSTKKDTYVFLVKWFQRFPHYRTSDFYVAGESYAGFYIPELVDAILRKTPTDPSLAIEVKGIMIGNGLMDLWADRKGMYDYLWSHTLISKETHQGLLNNCVEKLNSNCLEFQIMETVEVGDISLNNLISEPCNNSDLAFKPTCEETVNPCENNFVQVFLNLPQVKQAMHVNATQLHNHWYPCSLGINKSWKNSRGTMLPIYRRMIAAGIRILLYSGDMDGIIPWMSTQYSIDALNLTVTKTWRPWYDNNRQIGGYRIEYEGLVFSTVRGAGHEVPKYKPERAFYLIQRFLDGLALV